jgi:DNA modification methylase
MGAGTMALAAIEEGRHFVGIERDAGYCAIADQRIAAARRAHQPALDIQEATAQ